MLYVVGPKHLAPEFNGRDDGRSIAAVSSHAWMGVQPTAQQFQDGRLERNRTLNRAIFSVTGVDVEKVL